MVYFDHFLKNAPVLITPVPEYKEIGYTKKRFFNFIGTRGTKRTNNQKIKLKVIYQWNFSEIEVYL
jgi:hypothetical protein